MCVFSFRCFFFFFCATVHDVPEAVYSADATRAECVSVSGSRLVSRSFHLEFCKRRRVLTAGFSPFSARVSAFFFFFFLCPRKRSVTLCARRARADDLRRFAFAYPYGDHFFKKNKKKGKRKIKNKRHHLTLFPQTSAM